MKSIFILFLTVYSCFCWAIEGEISYEIDDPKSKLSTSKSLLIMGMKGDRLKFSYFFKFKGGETLTTFILDFQQKKGVYKKQTRNETFDFSKPYKNPKFLLPEELTATKVSKIILEQKAVEYESYYFVQKDRLPIKAWYVAHLSFGKYSPVWHMFQYYPDFILLNYLINPVTNNIALEISFKRADLSQVTFRCIKIDKRQLPDTYFNTK